MQELNKINEEGSTIMLVTHDRTVASKCGRVIYIEDGTIKGELVLGKNDKKEGKERERKVNQWLSDMGW